MNIITKLAPIAILSIICTGCVGTGGGNIWHSMTDGMGITSQQERDAKARDEAAAVNARLDMVKAIEQQLEAEAANFKSGTRPELREVGVIQSEITRLEVEAEGYSPKSNMAKVLSTRIAALKLELSNAAQKQTVVRDEATVLREEKQAEQLRRELQVEYETLTGSASPAPTPAAPQKSSKLERKVERQATRTATSAVPAVLKPLTR